MGEAVRGKGGPEGGPAGPKTGGGGIQNLGPFHLLHRTLNQIFTAAKYKIKSEVAWPVPVVAVARQSRPS